MVIPWRKILMQLIHCEIILEKKTHIEKLKSKSRLFNFAVVCNWRLSGTKCVHLLKVWILGIMDFGTEQPSDPCNTHQTICPCLLHQLSLFLYEHSNNLFFLFLSQPPNTLLICFVGYSLQPFQRQWKILSPLKLFKKQFNRPLFTNSVIFF